MDEEQHSGIYLARAHHNKHAAPTLNTAVVPVDRCPVYSRSTRRSADDFCKEGSAAVG